MEDYLKQYIDANTNFGDIMKESLQLNNRKIHSTSASFIDDLEIWITFNDKTNEEIIYKEAVSEYRAMLLFWSMGLYKYSFMALRGYFELMLFGIQLSTNELNFRLWKQSELDIYWSQIIDEEKGIFSEQFVKAFQPLFLENVKPMRLLAKKVYRECSEYIHSNYITTNTLPKNTCYKQEIYEAIGYKAEIINQVITFMLSVRYLDSIRKKDMLGRFENCIMDKIGYLPCVREIYN